MSALTDFYTGEATDVEGRWLYQIQDEDDYYWEAEHSYIQWLFPLKEPSNFNPDAPLLSEDDIALFKKNPVPFQINLRDSFIRFLKFLGLEWSGERIIKAENFDTRRKWCWNEINHNWLRITRCLTSLNLLGLKHEATLFYSCLKDLHENEKLISENSFGYWKAAMES